MSALNKSLAVATAAVIVASLTLGSGCSSSPSSGYKGGSIHYRHYHGHPWGPWNGFRRPVIVVPPGPGGGIDREVDPDWGVEAPPMPEAIPQPSVPDMGMPDFGGDMGMGMDMGGFDF